MSFKFTKLVSLDERTLIMYEGEKFEIEKYIEKYIPKQLNIAIEVSETLILFPNDASLIAFILNVGKEIPTSEINKKQDQLITLPKKVYNNIYVISINQSGVLVFAETEDNFLKADE
ncbi:hypothetical protein I2F17_11945 [Acinetobacter sp. B10A]|uniref:hypothetical protein n=1 Tax=Acinetobacter baretiae TaxID=2605383 RepID=UPI001B3C72A5|nr:hypothetical protein [Acinetobacter baretiae]MBF7686529.1 hypothetical protein [Acinetobacter baretiae]